MSRVLERTMFSLVALAALVETGCDDGSDSKCTSDAVEFADENLECAVREAIGKPTGDLCAEDVAGLTYLYAYDRDIASLDGIQAMPSLELLWLAENRISDISPLASIMALTDLRLNDNQISDLSPHCP